MKRIILLLILVFPLLLMAQSPQKLISKGEYDRAIEVCVKKIQKDRGDIDKLYASLKMAYETANGMDMDRIVDLKAGGEPDIWFEIFTLYSGMQKRYLTIYNIHDRLMRDQVNIKLSDYSKDLESARQKAAAYLYAHSQSLLKSGSKADAGRAFSELLKITRLYNDYKDVELLMRKALGSSVSLARLEVNNRSDANLSPDFVATLENIVLTYRERQYLNYVAKPEPGQQYSLVLAVDITSVKVTPGTVSEKEYTTSHKDPDSFAASYEDKSKFEEDKKHPDFNKCKINEIYQLKTAEIEGKLRYVDHPSGKVLYEVPVTAQAIFENKTATASGDMFACPPEVKELLDKPKKKFPKNSEMISRAGKEFKLLVKGIIWDPAFVN